MVGMLHKQHRCSHYVFLLSNADVRVYFERDTYEVSETDGTLEVCVRREGDISGSLTIEVSTGDFDPLQAEGIVRLCGRARPCGKKSSRYYNQKSYVTTTEQQAYTKTGGVKDRGNSKVTDA